MLDPVLAFQSAIISTLVTQPSLLAEMPALQIRASSARSDQMPCVTMSEGRAQHLGRASGAQRVARASLLLHIWTREEDGLDTAQRISLAIQHALEFGPRDTEHLAIDAWQQPTVAWLSDASAKLLHGVLALEADVRWRVAT